MFAGLIASLVGEATARAAWERLRPILANTTTLLIAVGIGLYFFGRHVGAGDARAAFAAERAAAIEAARAADAEIAAEAKRRAGYQLENRRGEAAANKEAVNEVRSHAAAHPASGDALTADDVRRLCRIGGCTAQPARR